MPRRAYDEQRHGPAGPKRAEKHWQNSGKTVAITSGKKSLSQKNRAPGPARETEKGHLARLPIERGNGHRRNDERGFVVPARPAMAAPSRPAPARPRRVVRRSGRASARWVWWWSFPAVSPVGPAGGGRWSLLASAVAPPVRSGRSVRRLPARGGFGRPAARGRWSLPLSSSATLRHRLSRAGWTGRRGAPRRLLCSVPLAALSVAPARPCGRASARLLFCRTYVLFGVVKPVECVYNRNKCRGKE